LNVTATGGAHVGDAAAVTGFAGTWIGELSNSKGTLPTGGAITATAIINLP
jgi:hypothetical protein